jgi:predicted phage gp36 major capsid-like protein
MNDTPKSALDLAMEKLRKQDADAGIQAKPLTDQQREAIAEVRRTYEARVAERKIMHQSEAAGVPDLAAANEELRRDLDRFERERDEKIKRIRSESNP